MSDPLARVPAQATPERSLFDLLPTPAGLSTRQEAHVAAVASAQERYAQILQLLRDHGPLTCWEIAGRLGCQLNAVSGRLSELKEQRMIEATGDRRRNPQTGRSGEVLRLMFLNCEVK